MQLQKHKVKKSQMLLQVLISIQQNSGGGLAVTTNMKETYYFVY